jgi:hypothetical protein
MEIVNAHIHCYDRTAPGRKNNGAEDSGYKKNMFSFEQKRRNDEIIYDVIICGDKNQIAEFDGHRFGNTYGIGSECNHPETVYDDPKKDMG